MVAEFGAPEMALYGSSKAALVLLTKVLGGRIRPGRGAGQRGQHVDKEPRYPLGIGCT